MCWSFDDLYSYGRYPSSRRLERKNDRADGEPPGPGLAALIPEICPRTQVGYPLSTQRLVALHFAWILSSEIGRNFFQLEGCGSIWCFLHLRRAPGVLGGPLKALLVWEFSKIRGLLLEDSHIKGAPILSSSPVIHICTVRPFIWLAWRYRRGTAR